MNKLVKRLRVMLEPPSNVCNYLQEEKVREFIDSFPEGSIIADLGSGRRKVSSKCLGVDIVSVPGVDVVGNLFNLPFKENSLDGIIIRGVLEHVPDPHTAVNEMERVLKPGGKVYSSIPFMQGYHPSPGDFQRYTIDGIQRLFSRFEKVECSITRGAGSAFVWIGREYLAQLFSFNNMMIYKALKMLFGWVMQPVKYTDHILNNHRMAHVAASGFTFIGRKAHSSR
jgi:SAM-dependent methyltransferase